LRHAQDGLRIRGTTFVQIIDLHSANTGYHAGISDIAFPLTVEISVGAY